jgi:hypothetical protein
LSIGNNGNGCGSAPPRAASIAQAFDNEAVCNASKVTMATSDRKLLAKRKKVHLNMHSSGCENEFPETAQALCRWNLSMISQANYRMLLGARNLDPIVRSGTAIDRWTGRNRSSRL